MKHIVGLSLNRDLCMQLAKRSIFSSTAAKADCLIGIIAGPQACGKSTVAAALARDADVQVRSHSLTHESRPDLEVASMRQADRCGSVDAGRRRAGAP